VKNRNWVENWNLSKIEIRLEPESLWNIEIGSKIEIYQKSKLGQNVKVCEKSKIKIYQKSKLVQNVKPWEKSKFGQKSKLGQNVKLCEKWKFIKNRT